MTAKSIAKNTAQKIAIAAEIGEFDLTFFVFNSRRDGVMSENCDVLCAVLRVLGGLCGETAMDPTSVTRSVLHPRRRSPDLGR